MLDFINKTGLPQEVWKKAADLLSIPRVMCLSAANKALNSALDALLEGREKELTRLWEKVHAKPISKILNNLPTARALLKAIRTHLPEKKQEDITHFAGYNHLLSLTIKQNQLKEEDIAKYAPEPSRITSLHLRTCKITFSPLSDALSNYISLTKLNLADTGISDVDLINFNKFIQLTDLNISLNKKIQGSCFLIFSLSLRVLNVAHCSIQQTYLTNLNLYPFFENLNLTRNKKIEDISFLPTTLTSLNLKSTIIDDDQCIHFSRLTRLQILNLSGTEYICGGNYAHFPTSLTELYMEYTWIAPVYYEAIKRTFTQLKKLTYELPPYI